jgi:hypothetical protein
MPEITAAAMEKGRHLYRPTLPRNHPASLGLNGLYGKYATKQAMVSAVNALAPEVRSSGT